MTALWDSDQRIGAGRPNLAEPGDHPRGCVLAFLAHDADEGIVAAGIENDEAQLLARDDTNRSSGMALLIGVAIARGELVSTGVRDRFRWISRP